MKKISKQKKESTPCTQKGKNQGHRPTVSVRRRAATCDEADICERAIDRLLTEWVRQERARRS